MSLQVDNPGNFSSNMNSEKTFASGLSAKISSLVLIMDLSKLQEKFGYGSRTQLLLWFECLCPFPKCVF